MQKKRHHFRSPEFTCPGEAGVHLGLRGRRLESPRAVKKCRNDIEPADARSSFQIQASTAIGKKLRGLAASVAQAAVNRTAAIPGVDGGAVFEQQLQQSQLHAGGFGMIARCRKSERR